jgi:hypothetical protein
MLSAISQNQPGIIEIKGLKTSHFKESKTAPLDRGEIGSMGHVECPQSEPANNDLQPGRSWMVATTNCERVGDQSRNGTPVSAAGKTGHFDRWLRGVSGSKTSHFDHRETSRGHTVKTSHFDSRRWGWTPESVRTLG